MGENRDVPLKDNKPTVYQIRVRGRISPSWSSRLEGMQITESHNSDGSVESTLVGSLSDQAALSGILNTLFDLHLPVTSVRSMDSTD